MEKNVQSFGVAINNGFEPRAYTFNADKIPLGVYEAMLDFKIWSRRIIAVNCYFTKLLTKEKIQLTVYGNNQTGLYIVPGSPIDFTTCATGVAYRITVARNNKGKIVLLKVEHLQPLHKGESL